MDKIISYRANSSDLEMLKDLQEWLIITWHKSGINKKVTISDVIYQAIVNDWQNKCLPFTTK